MKHPELSFILIANVFGIKEYLVYREGPKLLDPFRTTERASYTTNFRVIDSTRVYVGRTYSKQPVLAITIF